MEQQLWLGTAKVDITPQHKVPLAGFASRAEMGDFDGVAYPLHARVLCFRHVDDQRRETVALLVSADLLWWGSERIPYLKARIYEKWGIHEDAILFHGTHSHSGPQTSNRFSELLGKYDHAYVEQLEETVLAGIDRAVANQEPVSVEYGTGQCYIGINRRMMVDGECHARANKDGPCDSEMSVIRFRLSTGQPKAVLVHYACHPVVSQENMASSEFCGVAMDMIEHSLGEKVVAAYLQGSCGDINPADEGELFFAGTNKEVKKFGEILADEALRLLDGPLQPVPSRPLTVSRKTVMAPFQKVPTRSELEALTNEPWVKGEWSRKLLASPEYLMPEVPLDIVYLTLAEGLSLLATNSEIVAEYGLFMKQQSPGHVLPLGYTNGMIGYIPTAQQIDEGGYESVWSTEYFFLPSPFDPKIEPLFRRAIQEVIHD